MTGLEIAALIAALSGTAIQYKNSTDAARRATEATQRALQRQDGLQQQAEKKAMDTAKEFTTDDRTANQAQLEQQLTEQFTQPAAEAQAINSAQSTTQGNVSEDYTAAKARSDVKRATDLHTLARLMGKTTAAGRLRSNEAIRVADSAAGIDRLGSFSRGNAAADQLAIQNAARPNANMQLLGGLLQAGGSAGLAYGGSTGTTPGVGATASTSASSAAPIAGTTTGSIGFKLSPNYQWAPIR